MERSEPQNVHSAYLDNQGSCQGTENGAQNPFTYTMPPGKIPVVTSHIAGRRLWRVVPGLRSGLEGGGWGRWSRPTSGGSSSSLRLAKSPQVRGEQLPLQV